MSGKPDINERFHNLSVSIWKPDNGQRTPSCYIQRGYKLKGMDKPSNEEINCFCSDLVAFHGLLGKVIEQMMSAGGYPLEFKKSDDSK